MASESEIAESLKQKITAQPYTPPTPDTPTDDAPAFQSSVSLGDPIVATHLHDYFELSRADKYSEDRQRQLTTVLEWAAAKAQSNDILPILEVIQRKELEIGRSPFKDRLQSLYRLAKVEAQANFIELERQSIYGT